MRGSLVDPFLGHHYMDDIIAQLLSVNVGYRQSWLRDDDVVEACPVKGSPYVP